MSKYRVYYPLYTKIDEYIDVDADNEKQALQTAYDSVKYTGAVDLDIEELDVLERLEE